MRTAKWKFAWVKGELCCRKKSFTILKRRKKENRRNRGVDLKMFKPQELLICSHHDMHAERDWNLRLSISYHNLSGKVQIQVINTASPANCLDADKIFTLEALNTDQTNICKKASNQNLKEISLVNLLKRQKMGYMLPNF